jgi:tetratricopeptide (TPR) repeat protein
MPKVLLIAAVTGWIYWPALRGDFIWDDQWYIATNPLLHDGTGLWKFWFRPGSWVEYYPIQETVLWAQWQLWGNDTLGYHLTNLFLHVGNALLVWHLLSKFGLRFAWLGGLIFAIHPVQVESVAYICELKNTLSLTFYLLAMIAWIDYEAGKSTRDHQRALGLFLVAMLCKISMAPFPAVILLYAWWKRGRIEWGDVKACLPFVLITLVLVVVTIWAGNVYYKASHYLVPDTPLRGVLSRIDAIGLNASVYFARCFLPVDIMLVYPQWPLHPHALIEYSPWLILLALTSTLWWKRRSWGRHGLLGLGFFLISLSPFLGLTAVAYMNFIWVMDHFLYIPIIGLIGLVVAGFEGVNAQIPAWSRPWAVGGIASLFALMAAVSHAFAGLFVSEEVLWTHILLRNPASWLAHENLGSKLFNLKRYQEAIAQEEAAIILQPDSWDGHYNLAVALEQIGRIPEAQQQYRKVLELNPENAATYRSLGAILQRNGDLAEAETLFRQGLKIAPGDVTLCAHLAEILSQTGRVPEEIDLYEQVAELNPDIAQLQYNLGVLLLQAGRVPEAAKRLAAAVMLDPKIAPAHENLGVALARLGRLPDAMAEFQAVLELDPHATQARDNLALALAQTGHIPEAIEQFQQALQINPNDGKARDSLEKLQGLLKDRPPGN